MLQKLGLGTAAARRRRTFAAIAVAAVALAAPMFVLDAPHAQGQGGFGGPGGGAPSSEPESGENAAAEESGMESGGSVPGQPGAAMQQRRGRSARRGGYAGYGAVATNTRHLPPPETEFFPVPSPREQEILDTLRESVTIGIPSETPLRDALSILQSAVGGNLPFYFNTRALDDVGLSIDDPVELTVSGVSLSDAMRLTLGQQDLVFILKYGVVMITTPEDAEESGLLVRTYPVYDLATGESGLNHLIAVVTKTIAPLTWEEVGGQGTIVGVSDQGAIVVAQTLEVHENVLKLLRALRSQNALRMQAEQGAAPGGMGMGGMGGGMMGGYGAAGGYGGDSGYGAGAYGDAGGFGPYGAGGELGGGYGGETPYGAAGNAGGGYGGNYGGGGGYGGGGYGGGYGGGADAYGGGGYGAAGSGYSTPGGGYGGASGEVDEGPAEESNGGGGASGASGRTGGTGESGGGGY